MANLFGAQRLVLQAIQDSPKDSAGFVTDAQIAQSTKIAIQDIQDWIETLKRQDYVEVAEMTAGLSASITASGRLQLGVHQTTPTPWGVTKTPKPAFKGLRSYDQDDADFFLRLLPGRSDQNGLPPSVRFWKTRIEGMGSSPTFRIGLIHGPSGCGKSSMVKAGLIPHLASHVRCVYVEASPHETEAGLLDELQIACPELGEIRRLSKCMEALNQGRGISNGHKVLIVLDQFEQWLHVNSGAKKSDLVNALRRCDGRQVQSIVLVRDDYWTATSRFSENVKCRFVRDYNSQCLYLFEIPHGQYVLTTFGQDCGRLDDPVTPDQRVFVEQAIEMLAIERKILPVRLALFCLVFQGRKWTTQNLEALGGIANIEVEFFRYIFDFTYAEPTYREHREAAQAVLGALLPESGSNIKRSKPWADLLSVSGYVDQTARFEELVQLLDKHLYLITPTVNREVLNASGGETIATHDRHYQLTHDFLVPALRAWRNKDQEASQLVEGIVLAETKNVPQQVEKLEALQLRPWANPVLEKVIANSGGDSKERLHASLALLPVDDRQVEPVDDRQVEYLYSRLLDAGPAELEVIRDALHPFWERLVERLWHQFDESNGTNHTLQAASALALYDPDNPRWQATGGKVAEAMVKVNTVDFGFWLGALRPVGDRLTAALAALYRDRDRSETEHNKAAELLAEYASGQPRVLTNLLMDSGEDHFDRWFRKLAGFEEIAVPPLKGEMVKTLPEATEVEEEATEVEKDDLAKRQARAAIALVRFGQGNEVWPKLEHSPDPRLRSFIVNWLPPLGVSPQEIAAVLDRIVPVPKPTPAEGQQAMDAILFNPENSMRRALILALGQYGMDCLPSDREPLIAELLDLYRNDPDAGVHGAAEWTLRQWNQKDRLNAADAELIKFKEWGNRRWYINREGQTFAVIEGPVEFLMGSPPTEPDHRSPETLHRRRINRRFAIANKEVTVEQYRRFRHLEIDQYSPDPDGPMNGPSWYEAAAYCNWLSEQEGLDKGQWCYEPNSEGEYAEGMKIVPDVLERSGYRLPTEAEWEYACRARAVTSRYYGESDELLGHYAWYVQNSRNRAWPCGSLKPNDLGLFDMLGNVYEWCQDESRKYPQEKPLSEDVNRSSYVNENDPRLLRGGSFTNPPAIVRSAIRNWYAPSNRDTFVGFRPSRTYP
jgi:formylglycine-generating enzyme required for sulfatase activity